MVARHDPSPKCKKTHPVFCSMHPHKIPRNICGMAVHLNEVGKVLRWRLGMECGLGLMKVLGGRWGFRGEGTAESTNGGRYRLRIRLARGWRASPRGTRQNASTFRRGQGSGTSGPMALFPPTSHRAPFSQGPGQAVAWLPSQLFQHLGSWENPPPKYCLRVTSFFGGPLLKANSCGTLAEAEGRGSRFMPTLLSSMSLF